MFAISQIGINMLGLFSWTKTIVPSMIQHFAEFINKIAQMAFHIGSLILMLLDFVQELFRKIAGLEPLSAGDAQGEDILFTIFRSDAVVDAFASLIIVGILLLFLFTIIQFIRIEYTAEGAKNSRGNVVGQALRSLVMFLIVPVACVVGIILSNQLLKLLDNATSTEGTTISGQLFKISAYNANPIRAGSSQIVAAGIPVDGHEGSVAFQRMPYFGDLDDWEYKIKLCIDGTKNVYSVTGDNRTLISGLVKAPVVYENESYKFIDNAQVDFTRLLSTESFRFYTTSILPTIGDSNLDGQDSGAYLAERLDVIFSLPNSKATGDNGSLFALTQINQNDNLNYSNHKAVFYFYNINDINFFLMYLAGWFALKSLLFACFGLIMRLYMVTMLLIISPPVIAMAPMDNGKSFNQWRGKFVGQVVSAYGIVVGLNVFFKVVGVIQNINLFEPSYEADNTRLWSHMTASWYNSAFQMLAILVGCLMIKNISAVIAQLIGAEDALASGTQMKKEVSDTVAKGAVTAGKVGGMLATGGAFAVGRGMSLAAKLEAERRTSEGDAHVQSAEDEQRYSAGRLSSAQGGFDLARDSYLRDLNESSHRVWGRDYNQLDESEKASVQLDLKNMGSTGRLSQAREDLLSARSDFSSRQQDVDRAKQLREERLADPALQRQFIRGRVLSSKGQNIMGSHLKSTKIVKSFNDYTGNMFTAQGTAGVQKQLGKENEYYGQMIKTYSKEVSDAAEDKSIKRMGSITNSVNALNDLTVSQKMGEQMGININRLSEIQRGEVNIAQNSIESLAEVVARAQQRINNAGDNDALRERAEQDKYKAFGDMQDLMNGLVKDGLLASDNQMAVSSKLQSLEGGELTIEEFQADLQSDNFFETRIDAIMKDPETQAEMQKLKDVVKQDNRQAIQDALGNLERKFASGNVRIQSVEDIKNAILQSVADQKSQADLLKKLAELLNKQ